MRQCPGNPKIHQSAEKKKLLKIFHVISNFLRNLQKKVIKLRKGMSEKKKTAYN